MQVSHFYHVYCAGRWHEPVTEHLAALDASGYDGPFILGAIGSPRERQEALVVIGAIRVPDAVVSADEGVEQVTVEEIDRYVDTHTGAIMYAHTKGASTVSPIQDVWRRHMTRKVVAGWRTCEAAIADGYDAVGCFWLAASDWPGEEVPDSRWGWGHFSGNFWMASCEYLRALPPPSAVSRYGAEAWLGKGVAPPHVLDLLPDTPSPTWAEHDRRRALRHAAETSDGTYRPAEPRIARGPDG
jgi:hypothetical protein